MLDVWLVPSGMKTAGGSGEGFDIGGAQNRVFTFSLKVSSVLEQQALEVVLEWSPDGQSWGRMAAMPQQFYEGESESVLDLRKLPEVQWVRARWELERWGRGGSEVACDFSVRMRELPAS